MKRNIGSKKGSSWISSSFGGFDNDIEITKTVPSSKKQKSNLGNHIFKASTDASSVDEVSWLEYFTPSDESELAIHKKKVQEVKDWLASNVLQKSSSILLMTGPCGSGKSAVIKVLAKSFNCEIKEWINPVTEQFQERTEKTWVPFESNYESQNQKFSDFLLRANRYNSLCLEADSTIHRQNIVLVEDFPNFVFRDPAKFHSILRQYQQTGRSPLVFVMSDSHNSGNSVHTLFPNNIQQELRITNISFNAVATTQLKQLINRIVKVKSEEEKNLIKPSKDTIDLLIASSNGDIRSCVNLLQFYCTNKNPNEEKPKTRPKRKTKTKTDKKLTPALEEDSLLCNSGRDQSLFLFRSLGKVLYCKRTQLSHEEKNVQLPPHLKDFTRDLLQENPENIFERTQVSADNFLLYLHQNYLLFYSNIDDVCIGTDSVSDADIMSSFWDPQASLSNYTSSISIRGIMFANKLFSNKNSSWRPLQKPEYFQSYKMINRRCHIARELFKEHSNTKIFCEKIPYLGRMLPSSYSSYQSFFKEMLSYGSNVFRPQLLAESSELEYSFSYDQSQYTPQFGKDDEINDEELDDDIEDFLD